MTAPRWLTFDISLHPRPKAEASGPPHADRLGDWPTLSIPRDSAGLPMSVGGDAALAAVTRLERAFVEQDGSFVWTGMHEGRAWQVDGNVHELDGHVLLVDLRGRCPESEFDRLLAAFGWPEQEIFVRLVREGVALDDETFRRRAAAAFRETEGRG